MPAAKILVIGDVNGQFPAVFQKIAALHSKNAFSLALVVGNLFGDPSSAASEDHDNISSLIQEKIPIPLPTYFALGNYGLPGQIIEKLEANAGEVCSNLYFLGKRTTIKTSEGIRIVALGGILDRNLIVGASKEKYTPFYSEDDARVLRGANNADILITYEWPLSIRNGSRVDVNVQEDGVTSQQCIADLCSTLKPTYHFSRSSDFFEREPFYHAPTEAAPDAYRTTRFISLSSFNNPRKQKWIYAFSIDPATAPPTSIPPDTTASPLAFLGKKRPALPDQNSYRFSTHGSHGHHRQPHKRHRAAPPTPAECFFCLSNPNLATHLITSIGTDAYLTTAKGPLTTANTFPSLPFPAHILIISLTHAPTLANIDPESRESTFNEMQRYRHALQRMVTETSKSALGAVTWEVSRAGGVHTHWQFLPMPADMIRRGLVEAAFKVEAENEKYPAFQKKDVGDGSEEPSDFFRVLIWQPSDDSKDDDGEVLKGRETSFVLPLDPSFRFDLQFGRRVLAKLLGLGSRIHWQDCGQAHEDEVGDAEAFKKAFKPFDFSLED